MWRTLAQRSSRSWHSSSAELAQALLRSWKQHQKQPLV